MNSLNLNKFQAESDRGQIISNYSNTENVLRYFVGNNQRYRENIVIPAMFGAVKIKTREEKMIESVFESCPFKSAMSCVVGYALGAAVGLFSSSVGPTAGMGVEIEKQTAKQILLEMKGSMMSYGKNFAMVGGVFSAVECIIESHRGTSDWKNGTYAGAVTGGLIGVRGSKVLLFGS
uniref:Mitochondrial import inner membrane translocase subunit TIM22 n=1 Tax=Clastoptera arizonana TaxID=38151 RepID=A0A1B6E2J3_9HEMI